MAEPIAPAASEPAAPAPEQPAEQVSLQQVEELLRADQEAEQTGYEEPEPEPAPAVAPPAAPDDEPKGDLRIPLREERERRRQAEERARDLENRQATLTQLMAQITQQINPTPQPGEPKMPDFETDPAGFLKAQVDQANRTLAELRQQQESAKQEREQQDALRRVASAVEQEEAKFVAEHADYYEALEHVRSRLKAKFEVLGVPKEHVDRAVAEDLRQFGARQLLLKNNPAQKLYEFAKIEGYSGPREANEAKIATIAKGTAASRGARSTAPASNGELSIEEAVKLSPKQLAAMSEDEWRKVAGG